MTAIAAAVAFLFLLAPANANEDLDVRPLVLRPVEWGGDSRAEVAAPGPFRSVNVRRKFVVNASSLDWDGRSAASSVGQATAVSAVDIPPIGLRPWPVMPPRLPPTHRTPPGLNRPSLEFDSPPSDIAEGNSLVAELRDSTLLTPEEKRDVLAEWAVIAREHDDIVLGQERIVGQWTALDLERKFDRFAETYWSLVERSKTLEQRYAAYQTYCSRQVPREQYDGAVRECAEIKRGIDSDYRAFETDNAENTRFFEAEIGRPSRGFIADVEAHNQVYVAWLSRLKAFNAAARTRLRPKGEPAHISIHVQPDGQRGSASWVAGGTQPKPTRISAQVLLESVHGQTVAALGNQPPKLFGLEVAVTKYRTKLATHTQVKGRTSWTIPFGDRGQFRLDVEIYGEYPYSETSQ